MKRRNPFAKRRRKAPWWWGGKCPLSRDPFLEITRGKEWGPLLPDNHRRPVPSFGKITVLGGGKSSYMGKEGSPLLYRGVSPLPLHNKRKKKRSSKGGVAIQGFCYQ